MRNKFLGTGEPGWRPPRKLGVIVAGPRYAVLHDFSVMYKVALSVAALGVALWLLGWVDAALILLTSGLVVEAVRIRRASRPPWGVRSHVPPTRAQ